MNEVDAPINSQKQAPEMVPVLRLRKREKEMRKM